MRNRNPSPPPTYLPSSLKTDLGPAHLPLPAVPSHQKRSRLVSSPPNDQGNTLQKFLFECFKTAKRAFVKKFGSIPLSEPCGFGSVFSCLHARHTLGWHHISQLNPTTSLHLHS